LDIGQQEDREWIVIEANDAQFAGTCQIPALPLWIAIQAAFEREFMPR
jgi:hypothetical protein